jgi:hypothetical protein
MLLSGLKSSKENGILIYLIGSIAIEQSTRAITEDSFTPRTLRFGEGCAIFGEPDVIAHSGPDEAPCFFSAEMSSCRHLRRAAHHPPFQPAAQLAMFTVS